VQKLVPFDCPQKPRTALPDAVFALRSWLPSSTLEHASALHGPTPVNCAAMVEI
jgi:hypothetical protein